MYFLVILFFAWKYKPSLYKFLEAGSLLFGKIYINFWIVSSYLIQVSQAFFPMLPQSLHSCFSKASSKTQTFAENQYTEFLRSRNSNEEIWNLRSEGTVLTTDCSRVLVPVQKLFLTCVGSLWDILGMIVVLHTRSFVYWMVLGRLQLMFFAGYLCPFLCFSFSCELNVSALSFWQGIWSPCLLCLIQVSMCLFCTSHPVSSPLQCSHLLSS